MPSLSPRDYFLEVEQAVVSGKRDYPLSIFGAAKLTSRTFF